MAKLKRKPVPLAEGQKEIYRSYRVELNPTKEQVKTFSLWCEARRLCFNFANGYLMDVYKYNQDVTDYNKVIDERLAKLGQPVIKSARFKKTKEKEETPDIKAPKPPDSWGCNEVTRVHNDEVIDDQKKSYMIYPTSFSLDHMLREESKKPYFRERVGIFSSEIIGRTLKSLCDSWSSFRARRASIFKKYEAIQNLTSRDKKRRKLELDRCKPPHFIKKGESTSFQIKDIRAYKECIDIPLIAGIALKEHGYVPTSNVKFSFATIFTEIGRWYASVSSAEPYTLAKKIDDTLGVDLGVRNTVSTSSGFEGTVQKTTKREWNKLKRLDRATSRKRKFSKNWHKAMNEKRRFEQHLRNRRTDQARKIAAKVVAPVAGVIPFNHIKFEDLYIEGMAKFKGMGKTIHGAIMAKVRDKIVIRAEREDIPVELIDRFYPSTQLCHCCGTVNKSIKLGQSVFKCVNPKCGNVDDRDHNASINIKECMQMSNRKLVKNYA